MVFHFAAIAYVGESMVDPLRYYSNITANTVTLLSVMNEKGVQKMIYSSTSSISFRAEKLPIHHGADSDQAHQSVREIKVLR